MSKWKMLKCRSGRYAIYNEHLPGSRMKTADTKEEALKLRKELNDLLQKGDEQ